MASKPTVTLTLAGDSEKLTKAFDQVGADAKQMEREISTASKGVVSAGQEAGKGFDTAIEGFDTADTRAMGFRDTITGVQDTMKGLTDDSLSLGDRLLTLGMGVGDLASGFVNLLLPALRTMWTTLVTNVIPAIWSTTSALLASPITWIVLGIIALIAILILLVTHWDQVKAVVGNVVNWIVDRWSGLMGWFAGVPGWFGRIFGAVGSAIGGAFKSAINFVIGLVNGGINKINWLLDRVNDVSGIVGIPAVPHIPHVPRLHSGGIVPGPMGSEQLAILQASEKVTPRGESGGGGVALRVAPGGDAEVGSLIDRLVQTGVITAVAVS